MWHKNVLMLTREWEIYKLFEVLIQISRQMAFYSFTLDDWQATLIANLSLSEILQWCTSQKPDVKGMYWYWRVFPATTNGILNGLRVDPGLQSFIPISEENMSRTRKSASDWKRIDFCHMSLCQHLGWFVEIPSRFQNKLFVEEVGACLQTLYGTAECVPFIK